MARRLAIVLGIVVLVPLLLVGALVLVIQSEWAEKRVEGMVASRLHREVQLETIRLHAAWPPEISLAKLRIANPEWAKTKDLIDAEGLRAQVLVWPLFRRQVVVPNLSARLAKAGIEQSGDRATWKFGDQEKGPTRIHLARVALEDGHIVYRDEDEDTALDIDAKGTFGEKGELNVVASGKFRGEATKGTATLPSLEPDPTMPVEFKGHATVGRTTMSAQGSVGSHLDTFDFKFDLSGHTFKDLHKVFGLVLPDTPPYKLAGRLRHEKNDFVFDPLQGTVGDSDLRGTFTYRKGEPRPMMVANLQSKLLDFKDLGPVIGTAKNAEGRPVAVGDKVLPHAPFSTERWEQMDADVKLKAMRVLRPQALPLDSLSTHLILKDGVLHLEPLDFGVAEGRITSNIVIDSHQSPPAATLKADIQGLKMAELFPTLGSMKEAFGTVYGRADLKGRGASVGDILGTSDGKLVVAANGGRVSDLLVQLLEIDVAKAAMLLGTRNQQVELNCAVGHFKVAGGVVEPENFVVDTNETFVKVDGKVNLAEERLDIVTRGRGKTPSIFVLKSPVVLEGSFKKPSVRAKAGPIVAQAAAGAALAAVAPPLAIAPFVDPGHKQGADCSTLLAEARGAGAVKKTS